MLFRDLYAAGNGRADRLVVTRFCGLGADCQYLDDRRLHLNTTRTTKALCIKAARLTTWTYLTQQIQNVDD